MGENPNFSKMVELISVKENISGKNKAAIATGGSNFNKASSQANHRSAFQDSADA